MGAESSTMQNAATACKGGCKNLGDRQIDTVKFDMGKLNAAGKENSDPGQMHESPAQKNQRQEQEQKEAEQEARRRAEDLRKLEEQRQRELEEVRKRLEEEEAARIAKDEEARRVELARITAQKRRQAEEEERLRRQQRKEEEEARQRKEEEEARLRRQKEEEEEAAEARRVEEEDKTRKRERLGAFLQKEGFKAVSDKKVKKGMISSGFFYPLHAAVEQKDAEAIELLLCAGADPCLTNSKKLTPMKLAQARNKQGSHDKVMAALAA